MAKRRKHEAKSRNVGRRNSSRGGVGVARAASGQGWTLTHPRCVLERSEDLDEVRAMIAGGEPDVAIDELRWLLEGCSEMIEAHFLLGKLAVEADGDVKLARGHFGFGFQLGDKALRRAGNPTPVPALHPANRAFFDAGRGLAWCLHDLGRSEMAEEIVQRLLACDPGDALGMGGWLEEIQTSGKPIVSIDQLFGG